MNTRIKTKLTTIGGRDGRWLGDSHGLDIAMAGTFVLSTFTEATHYPDGWLKDGLPVGKITASGEFGLYDAAANDGRENLYGFILDPAIVEAGDTEVVSAIYHHGGIRLSALPVAVTESVLPARLWAR